jgi:hypothetical protein
MAGERRLRRIKPQPEPHHPTQRAHGETSRLSLGSITETADDLCTSDLGYTFGFDQVEHAGRLKDRAYLMVPVSKRTLLFVAPEPEVRVLEWHYGRWGREIGAFSANQVDASDVNDAIARYAQDFIAGSEQAVRSVDPTSIARISSAEIQKVQEIWPYHTKTTELGRVAKPFEG